MHSAASKPKSKRSARRIVLALAFFAGMVTLAAIAGTYVGRHWNQEVDTLDPATVSSRPGQRLAYHVDFDSASLTNFGTLFSETPSPSLSPFGLSHLFQAHLQGELAVTLLETADDHVSLVYEFRNPEVHFQAEGVDEPDQSKMIQTSLSQPIFCRLDRSGRVEAVRFDPAANSVAQRVACTLLAAMQIVKPDAGVNSTAQWDAEEEDPSGKFLRTLPGAIGWNDS